MSDEYADLISAIWSEDGDDGTVMLPRKSMFASGDFSVESDIGRTEDDRRSGGSGSGYSLCNMRKSLQSSQLNKTPCISGQMTTVTTADCSP
jgi:hypothetical protein